MVLGGSLGRVRDLVPHDRVDHLEPLAGHCLQGLAVAHAALAAAPVVVAEAVPAPHQGVAREDEQVLQPLVALPGRAHRRYGRPRLPVPGRDPAARCRMVVVGEVRDVDGDDGLGRRARTSPGLVTGHAQRDDFPTPRPRTALQLTACLIMAVPFQSPVDRKAASCDAHITWPWRSWQRARQFPISRRKQRRPRRQHPPGPRRAGARGRPRAPDRRSAGTHRNRNPVKQADPRATGLTAAPTVMGDMAPPHHPMRRDRSP